MRLENLFQNKCELEVGAAALNTKNESSSVWFEERPVIPEPVRCRWVVVDKQNAVASFKMCPVRGAIRENPGNNQNVSRIVRIGVQPSLVVDCWPVPGRSFFDINGVVRPVNGSGESAQNAQANAAGMGTVPVAVAERGDDPGHAGIPKANIADALDRGRRCATIGPLGKYAVIVTGKRMHEMISANKPGIKPQFDFA